MQFQMQVKCTTCKKSLPATDAQIAEARDMGCFFSTCCHAVATVHSVKVTEAKTEKRGASAR